MRWVFISGTGDVVGTFKQWKSGEEDNRVPVLTYSSMLYQLVKRNNDTLHVVHSHGDREELVDGDFKFSGLDYKKTTSSLGYFLDQFNVGLQMLVKTYRSKPDIVLVHYHAPLYVLPLLPRRAKVILTLHNTFWPMHQPPGQGWKDRVRAWARRVTLNRLDGAVCTSAECARQLDATVTKKFPISVERPAMRRAVKLKVRSERVRQLIYVGRVEENKGVFLLLQAFESLASTRPELTLTFIGDGGALSELQDRCDNSPMADRLRVTGRLLADDVNTELAKTDLLICPTMSGFNEGLALVGLEAAAHGVPSVLSSIVPAQDILGQACRIYDVDQLESLKTTLAEILDSPELYQSMITEAEKLSAQLQDGTETWGRKLAEIVEDIT